jgi:hypothetical protein
MSPKPEGKPTKVLDPRAFRRILDEVPRRTMAERKAHAMEIKDEIIAKRNYLKGKRDAG